MLLIRLFFIYIILLNVFNSLSYKFVNINSKEAVKLPINQNFYSKKDFKLNDKSNNEDALSRRRKRIAKSKEENIKTDNKENVVSPVNDASFSKVKEPINNIVLPKPKDILDNSAIDTVEKLFGLGDEQLRELLEQELPVPREDLVSKKELKTVDKDKVFNLPELSEYLRESAKDKKIQQLDGLTDTQREKEEDENRRVSRGDQEEYLRVLQLNPFADADDTLFLEEYDIIPSIFGSGKLLNIPISFLQNGHGLLFIIVSLGAFIYAPGNPLTDFPYEIREFLKTGLAIVYSINFVLSIIAFNVAKSKNLPAIFWLIKTLLIGGIAYYEVTQAKDPKVIKEQSIISQKKSKRRVK
mmetsp:Transcript_5595/g.5033  ORF Transcript_5595/g.5033 Transcript_5595/m.5033 type:complete len:355 (-) Transcript_5595:8-1072(-)